MCPVEGNSELSARMRASGALPAGTPWPRFAQERYSVSFTLKRTQMGSRGTMVVSGWAELGVTRPPMGSSESPMRPPMGARTVPYCRFRSEPNPDGVEGNDGGQRLGGVGGHQTADGEQ